MRFMMIIRTDARAEAGALPAPELFEAMGKYNQSMLNAGVLVGAEGLLPSSKGFRVVTEGGNTRVIDGPFTEAKELIAGYWILDVASRDEAIQWALRCPFEAGCADTTPGDTARLDVFQLLDMNHMPASDDPAWRDAFEMCGGARTAAAPVAGDRKIRYMLIFRGDANSEAGLPPPPEKMVQFSAMMSDMARQGVLVANEGLLPSSHGARITFCDGDRRVIDGPFTEAKELIAGFCIIRVGSKQECLEWVMRGAAIHGDGTAEMRQVCELEDFPADLVAQAPATIETKRAMRDRLSP